MYIPDFKLDPPEQEIAFYCDECGEGIVEGEDYYEIAGYFYCENCVRLFRDIAEKRA